MKEKIIEILHNLVLADNLATTWKIKCHKASNNIEQLVNLEVEKRIKERMDETEAVFLERWIRTFNLFSDTSAFCHGYRRMREERDKLRSRLTPQVTPQDTPQVEKTEGGKK